MAYTPPSGNVANFDLLIYVSPAGDVANFELADSTPSERDSEISGIGTAQSERSSEISGINIIPLKLAYRLIVHDENDVPIGEFEAFKSLKFGKRLNNYGSCEFQILVNDPKLSELISLRRYSVHVYRKSGDTITRVWAGQQALRSGSLDNKGLGWVTIRCFTWLELLNMRYTSQEYIYTQVDAGEIAWDLIDRTQLQWETHNTGLTLPGTAADDSAVGAEAWGSVNNIKTDDSNTASFEPFVTSLGVDHLVSHYIKATNFGFAIPSNANILGIRVDIKAESEVGTTPSIYTSAIKLIKSGTIQAFNLTDARKWPEVPGSVLTYGGEDILWDDDTLTPSDINSSGFGVAISGTGQDIEDGFSDPGGFYYVKINVYYETPSSSDNGNFGITRGSIEATIDRDRTYQNDNIMQEIIALTNVLSGFDAEITDDKVFNVYSIQGSDLTDSVVLEYGKNIESMKIDEDFIHPVNRAIVLGEVDGENTLQRVERNETDSQDNFKIREDVDTESTVSEIETLEDKGDAMLRKYILPLLKVDISLVKGCAENITQFGIGDLIRLTVKYGLYNIDEEYRIFEWEVTYGQDGSESLTLTLGRFTLPTPLFS